jgi:membrane protein
MMDPRNPRDAAAISYFSSLALIPAVLVLIAVANDILGKFDFGKSSIVVRIVALFPVAKNFLEENLSQIIDPPASLVLSCIVVVMWTSSWVFSIVENALNRAWNVPKQRSFWESRIRSITVVAAGGTILLASVAIIAVASPVSDATRERLLVYAADPIISWVWKAVLLSASFLLAILVFCCIYKLMPEKKVTWVEAVSGALVSALLWETVSVIFIDLIPFFDYERVYGRMAAVIALLAWVYSSNLIMLFGAHFSAQLRGPAALPELATEEVASAKQFAGRTKGKVRSFPRYR